MPTTAQVEAPEGHVARAVRALELVALAPRTRVELADELGVHPRTVRRLLDSLVAEGYVAAEGDAPRTYAATMKVVALAGRVLDRTSLVAVAFPYVTRLRNRTGEAAHLSVPTPSAVMHVIQETGESVVMVKPRVGEQVAYPTTAVGKALLAHLPAQLERVLAAPIEQRTPHTLTDPAALAADLERVRRRGYAVDDREDSPDLRCVAAPVFDHTGEAVAALGVSAPSSRLLRDRVAGVGADVAEVAAALSEALGWATRA